MADPLPQAGRPGRLHTADTLTTRVRRAIALLGVGAAAALAAAGPGNAGWGTGESGLWVCGPHHAAHLTGAIEQEVPVEYKQGLQASAPPPPQAFYRLDLNGSTTCALNTPGQSAYLVPAAGEVRILGPAGSAFWVELDPAVTAKLQRAVSQVKAYGAPTTVTSVLINDQDAVGPSSYLRLYTIGRPVKTAPRRVHWLFISLLGASPASPWTDGKNGLWVSHRGQNYLKRDGQLVRIAASVATRIRRAQSIWK